MRTPPSSPRERREIRRAHELGGVFVSPDDTRQWNLGQSAELRVWTFVPRFLSSGDWRGSKPRHGHSAGFVFRAGRQGNQDRTRQRERIVKPQESVKRRNFVRRCYLPLFAPGRRCEPDRRARRAGRFAGTFLAGSGLTAGP
jgi:hypothetical protein